MRLKLSGQMHLKKFKKQQIFGLGYFFLEENNSFL